jgi:hypothetical protein
VLVYLLEFYYYPERRRTFPANTLVHSSGDLRSRSTSELLFSQKTKLPRLSTVCSGKSVTASKLPIPDHLSGIIKLDLLLDENK